ncbi:MAG: DUF2723 domain-containing protein [Bacteroidales bacterium]|nr:DUF2723 domain-containing protein [Bacteroidales bacterium]
MKRFQLLNTLVGWVVFIIASIVYLSTIEPTASFWDCGEFIASAFKLEVGHPPGAPFFMILARFFTIFARNDVTSVAKMVNSLSALASAFTILFLFWTITHLAKKFVSQSENQISSAAIILILGSGVIGSLAYTFSDSFWFSAVEGEVYATSSLFTALVFWAILKWENIADKKFANRWLILIAYLMGLSIGVHLLNLLAIPAIVLVYYFRKYKSDTKGVLKALFVSAVILGGIMYVIIPGVVKLAEVFERLFVNGFHLPYNSGVIFYLVLLLTGITWGIYYTYRKKIALANTIIVSITVILIGYSSYATIVIRSKANPPMDQNNPENLFNLLSYLNREQYGDRPLIYGQYFNAPVIDSKDGKPIYYASEGKYKIAYRKPKYNYDKNYLTLFPRMYSPDNQHIEAYIEWAKLRENELYNPRLDNNGNVLRDNQNNIVYDYSSPKRTPGFIANLRFFFRYQLNHMYIRYFMWNFAGRQNDIQGHSKFEINKGNWLSGVKFIDEARLGNQENLPRILLENKGRNIYFMLPLLLGLFGIFSQFKSDNKNFWVVAALFLLTGFAIVIYLNQYPFQPRERDYAYSGSFYAFAIWIGLGVAALFKAATEITWRTIYTKGLYAGIIVFVILILDMIITKTLGLSLSLIYLGGLSIIVIIIMKLSGILIKNHVLIALLAIILSLPVPFLMATENWDDHDRSDRYVARDIAYDYLNSCAPDAILYTNGDNDTFPLWYIQEVEGVRTDVRVVNLSYLGADWYIEQMERKAYDSDPLPMNLTREDYMQGKLEYVALVPDDRIKNFVDVKVALEFLADDDPRTKHIPNYRERIEYIPTRNFSIPADSAIIMETHAVRRELASLLVPSVEWTINKNYITKSNIMVLDMLSASNWERPVYFAITVSSDNYLNLEEYFQVQGLAYRVVPIKYEPRGYNRGGIDTEITYDNMINKFRWGGIDNPNVYLDENITRMLSNIRNSFAQLAESLIEENKMDSAAVVLDRCTELIPDQILPYNIFMLPIIESYFKAGQIEKGKEMAQILARNTYNELDYYVSLTGEFESYLTYEKSLNMHVLRELLQYSGDNNLEELRSEFEEKFHQYALALNFYAQ